MQENQSSQLLQTVNSRRIPLLSAFTIRQLSVSMRTTLMLITAVSAIPFFTVNLMTLTLTS